LGRRVRQGRSYILYPLRGGALQGLSRTVAFHKYGTMEELGIKTSAELVQFAIKHHVIAG
jgi:hypothetical protein